jgi:cell division protein FtsW (lipid II flippase)
MEGTKLEKFLPKNQHTQRKLFNFENWISGGLRSFQKSEFLKSIIFILSGKKYLKWKSWFNFNAIIVFY